MLRNYPVFLLVGIGCIVGGVLVGGAVDIGYSRLRTELHDMRTECEKFGYGKWVGNGRGQPSFVIVAPSEQGRREIRGDNKPIGGNSPIGADSPKIIGGSSPASGD